MRPHRIASWSDFRGISFWRLNGAEAIVSEGQPPRQRAHDAGGLTILALEIAHEHLQVRRFVGRTSARPTVHLAIGRPVRPRNDAHCEISLGCPRLGLAVEQRLLIEIVDWREGRHDLPKARPKGLGNSGRLVTCGTTAVGGTRTGCECRGRQ